MMLTADDWMHPFIGAVSSATGLDAITEMTTRETPSDAYEMADANGAR
jgi:hypothetical protein